MLCKEIRFAVARIACPTIRSGIEEPNLEKIAAEKATVEDMPFFSAACIVVMAAE